MLGIFLVLGDAEHIRTREECVGGPGTWLSLPSTRGEFRPGAGAVGNSGGLTTSVRACGGEIFR